MKNIRDLKIKTKEGFEIKNYMRFPSREWGDEGGCKADVYYKGAYVGTMYNKGDGGMADFDFDNSISKDKKTEIKTELLKFLKRIDDAYSEYSWLKNKTPETINGDDFDALVMNFEKCYFSLMKLSII